VILEGSPAVVRAHRLTDAADAAVKRASTSAQLFSSLGEVLMWLIALEDLLVGADGEYRSKRDADPDGAVLPGIRYARNAVVHGAEVTSTVYSSGGSMFGAAVFGAAYFGEGPSTGWSGRSSIGYTPPKPRSPQQGALVRQQEQSYDDEIAGQAVTPPLDRALAFLRTAAGT
jgi:hypothetical protein